MFEISNVGVLAAFLAGMISFLSPCVLPLVPGYVSYISGAVSSDTGPQAKSRVSATILSACFVSGFSLIFITLGASATLASRYLLAYRYETNILGGAIIIVFGLFTAGLINFSWMHRDVRFHQNVQGGSGLGAFLMGLAFGFGWTPCIGPVLGAILTVSAVSENVSAGIVLLSIYSLGLGLPFLLSAIFTDGLIRRMSLMRRSGRILKMVAGGVMVLMGAAMITGYMTSMSFWLMQNFPVFSRIG